MIESTELTSGWTVRPASPAPGAPAGAKKWKLPATVPSVVHTVLLEHGRIADPYVGQNEELQHWVGRSEWEYATTFTHDPADSRRTELVFDGLDTVAVVRVNGQEVARTFNQHRSYVVDVTDRIRAGANDLTITFLNVRDYAEGIRAASGVQPNGNPEPFQYVRKSACNFGWDWGPNLVTAGPWRPVSIRRYGTARLNTVRPSITTTAAQEPDGGLPARGEARIEVDVEVARAAGAAARELTLTIECGGRSASVLLHPGSTTARAVVELSDVDLWWPHDMGEQPLFQLTVTLQADGRRLDAWSKKIGFRQFELKTEPDEAGSSFVFAINGIDIFVKGANWIPDDCFPSRITEDRLRQRLTQATAANMNLLRVWGGGVYESDAFYELCDSLGLLVWQDFLFACAGYPEEGPLYDEVAREAQDNVVRLMHHPSLVLWNGNNECFWGFWDWNWKQELDGRGWGRRYYTDLLPAVVAELDPARPYWAGSPYSGDPERHPNDPRHGNVHIWDVWNEDDYAHYADWNPRFVSEFGYQGPPNWSTLTRALEPAELDLDAPAFQQHQKAEDGGAKLQRGLSAHLPMPSDFQEWHFLTQVNQARAIKFGIEHFRAGWPRCAGSIVWQLNDCWPVVSWAAVDGDGRPKPLWFAIREAYRPRLATVQPRGGSLALVLVNDSARAWEGTVGLELLSACPPAAADGRALPVEASGQFDLRVPPRETVEVPVPLEMQETGLPSTAVLAIRGPDISGSGRLLYFFGEDKDRITTPARVTARSIRVPDGIDVTVTALTVVRDLVLQADRLDPAASVSDQCVSLLPGESHTFRITTACADEDPPALEAWCRHPVLQAVGLKEDGIGAPAPYYGSGAPRQSVPGPV
ncbi:glycoside hydrolase family 2 protein [Arthrobacter sp. MMS24-T111]